MKFRNSVGPSLGLVALLSLAACGGSSGNGGDNGNNGPTGSAPRDITAIGAITGFGSVFVNGARYEVTASTRISIEDEMETTGDDSVLRLGMNGGKHRIRRRFEGSDREHYAGRLRSHNRDDLCHESDCHHRCQHGVRRRYRQ